MSQSVSSSAVDRGLLLIRVALGVVFVMHGWMKLTVLGLAGTAGFFGSVGIPLPMLNAVLVTALEFGGGLLFILGAGTRIIGALQVMSMAVAVLTVHGPNGFFLPNGYEFALTLGLVSLAVVFTGPGRYSVDAWLSRRPGSTVSADLAYPKAA